MLSKWYEISVTLTTGNGRTQTLTQKNFNGLKKSGPNEWNNKRKAPPIKSV